MIREFKLAIDILINILRRKIHDYKVIYAIISEAKERDSYKFLNNNFKYKINYKRIFKYKFKY